MTEDPTRHLIREMIHEILLQESLQSDWNSLVEYARTPYSVILTESELRGSLITEGLIDNIISVFDWTKEKLAGGFEKIKSLGGKVFEAFQKIIAKIFETMQSGKEAFEFVTSFTSNTVNQIKGKFIESFGELKEWISSVKEFLFKDIFETASKDPKILNQLKESHDIDSSFEGKNLKFLLENQNTSLKAEFISQLKSNPTAAAELASGSGREALGDLVTALVRTTIKNKPDLVKRLREKIFSSPFMRGPKGNFIVSLINFTGISINAAGDKIIELGAKLWQSIKNLLAGQTINIEKNDQNLINDELFPEIIGSLIGGESVIEKFSRSLMGDLKSLGDIFIATIKQIAIVISGKLENKFDDICSSLSIPQNISNQIKNVLKTTLNIATNTARIANSTSNT